ncbi:hypothetical protein MPC4_400007 [Methylocella tundrae]|uniref:Uncharacterized protein n=1 Tax=Methylocella tundrae TaxID=227605 RepID=A0A8B6MC73_METTU|nr:hypothetical protein MPC1_110009 [Methylocella tundrae]VTZ51606.1 hypothetical protein MPC4_400007 [Methylocella tundrae]
MQYEGAIARSHYNTEARLDWLTRIAERVSLSRCGGIRPRWRSTPRRCLEHANGPEAGTSEPFKTDRSLTP